MNINIRKLFFSLFLILSACLITSCRQEYFEENNIPPGLGKSIYDYLQNDGHYTNYIRLINDLEYADVLSRTGSKTLFVADDDAFNRFYANNTWGVKRYEDFSLAQKRLIMNSSMINNAILLENLSTISGPVAGQALRRQTALAVMDTLTFESGSDLPANSYWDRFRDKGIHIAKDRTPVPMVHFLQAEMLAHNITDNDFSIIFNGAQRASDDAYIFNDKVVQRDIICQNGYIHVLADVLIPPSNMAEVIRKAPETHLFSSFLERFAAPYYDPNLTSQYQSVGGTDSVFSKAYFSQRSNTATYIASSQVVIDPNGYNVSDFLLYDPGWNFYNSSNTIGSFQTDMGVIFAPSDDALNRYFQSGSGRALIERYGSIENIPNGVLDKLVVNHMKPSFLASLPSLFGTVVDDAQEPMGIQPADVNKVYLACNGVVYVMNTVYPPALYSSVMFPATINENMKVFNWAIAQLQYDAYLLSMVNYYSFFLPTDKFTYIPPTTLKHDQPEAWKFHYNNATNTVYASRHPYDPATGQIGDSMAVQTSATVLKNLLQDMLDYHIVVGNIEDGSDYYRTKGGGTIHIFRNGNQIQVAGGGDIDRNTSLPVDEVYDQTQATNGRGNGKTYVLDRPIASPLRSVYDILSTTPEFSEFFALAQGNDDLWIGDNVRAAKYSVFYKDPSQSGLDLNVRFLSTYHYTLYVPTNDEVQKAIQNGLPTWDNVEAATDQDVRDSLADKIIRFVRYHFQDNSVFLDKTTTSGAFETATLNNNTETFYKLALSGGNYSLNVTDETRETAHVVTANGLYNIMARDFKFDTPDPATATMIETSSYIVIHQIDKCLYFE